MFEVKNCHIYRKLRIFEKLILPGEISRETHQPCDIALFIKFGTVFVLKLILAKIISVMQTSYSSMHSAV
jgi:hypothetical protein